MPGPAGISFRMPRAERGVDAVYLQRGRRNTKPFTGAYIPPQPARKEAHSDFEDDEW